MSIHSEMQICGNDHEINVNRHHGSDWVTIKFGNAQITMNPEHVRALNAALDAYYAAKEQEARP